MTVSTFPKTQPLAVGVRIGTDCQVVLSGWAPERQTIALRRVTERFTRRPCAVCASKLLPEQSPSLLPNISSGIFPVYFTL